MRANCVRIAPLVLLICCCALSPAQDQYSIYGTVTLQGTGAPLGGVRMNGLPGTPYTNTDGVYAMMVPSGWSGTVTPILAGYTFTPEIRSYDNVTAMQADQNFVASPGVSKYLITGKVTVEGTGAPIPNVWFPGPMNSSYSNADGIYTLWVPPGWTGTVTPGHSFIADYTFTPSGRSYANVSSPQLDQDYIGIPPATQWVNGRVAVAGTGAALAGVLLDGLPVTTITNGAGTYHGQVPRGWTGTVTPRLAGYTFVPSSRSYNNVMANSATENYTATPTAGNVEGIVTTGGRPFPGVTVNLLDIHGLPEAGFAPVVTDLAGHYAFQQVPAGSIQIMIVEPWGYAADQNPAQVSIASGSTSEADFVLTPLVTSSNAANWSYWKDQFDKAVNGQKGDVTPADLNGYIASIQQHYTPHFAVFAAAISDTDWQIVLSKSGHSKQDDALAELAALLMNMSSLKLAQYAIVTQDNQNVGDVLTYVSQLVANANATDKDFEQAKKIAQMVNQAMKIKAGLVQPGGILYKSGSPRTARSFENPSSFALYDNYPNPFNPSTTIRYQLPQRSHVALTVCNALGQVVRALVNEDEEAGYHEVTFDGTNCASGVYLYRIQAGTFVVTKRLILCK